MIKFTPKDSENYFIELPSNLSTREQKKLLYTLESYGAKESRSGLVMDHWMTKNYLRSEEGILSTLDHCSNFYKEQKRRDEFLTESAQYDLWRSKLNDSQKSFVEWFHNECKNAALCVMGCGVGKTRASLAAAFTEDPRAAILVVTVKSCRTQWIEELGKINYKGQSSVIASNCFRLPQSGEVLVTNWDNLPPLKKEAKDKAPMENFLAKLPPVFYLIADEAVRVKSNKTQITKRFRKLKDHVLKRGGKLIALTAAPVENNPKEFWDLLTSCGLEKVSYGNFNYFCKIFGGQKNPWFHHIEWTGQRDQEAIKARKPLYMFQASQDTKRTVNEREVYVDISDSLRKDLDALQDASEGLSDDEILKFALSFKNMPKIRTALSKAKLKGAMELIETLEDQGPVLAATTSVEVAETLGKRKNWCYLHGQTAAKERDRMRDELNAGRINLVFTIRAGGIGQNLRGAQNLVFIDRDYSHSWNTQVKGRNNRSDSVFDELFYHYIVADHPFERNLSRILNEKEKLANDVLG